MLPQARLDAEGVVIQIKFHEDARRFEAQIIDPAASWQTSKHRLLTGTMHSCSRKPMNKYVPCALGAHIAGNCQKALRHNISSGIMTALHDSY